jgi:prevent-host-death family protein
MEARMKQMTARGARRSFGQVLAKVEAGEQVLITRRGRPVAMLSAYNVDPTLDRQAAVERLKATMDEPVEFGAPFRTFSRDEMHDR